MPAKRLLLGSQLLAVGFDSVFEGLLVVADTRVSICSIREIS